MKITLTDVIGFGGLFILIGSVGYGYGYVNGLILLGALMLIAATKRADK